MARSCFECPSEDGNSHARVVSPHSRALWLSLPSSLLRASSDMRESHNPLQWVMGTGNRNMAVWHRCNEHFLQALHSWKHSPWNLREGTQSQGQPLAGRPAGTGHWIPAIWGLSLCCPQGGEGAVRGKGRKAAPLPSMASSSVCCLGLPSLRSIPMGGQPQGVKSRTCDGSTPARLALGSQHGTSF